MYTNVNVYKVKKLRMGRFKMEGSQGNHVIILVNTLERWTQNFSTLFININCERVMKAGKRIKQN